MRKRQRPKDRRLGMTSVTMEAMKPIFGKGASDIVPGELIVRLHEDVAAQVAASIPRGPTRARTAGLATAFGVTVLDTITKKLNVTSITRLHPPAPPAIAAPAAMEHAVSMASTFRITYEGGTKVETAVEQVTAVEGVEFAEPNRYRESSVVPNDPSFPTQWGLSKLNCPAAWDRTTGSSSVIVGVIDTGVDLDHPELQPLILPGWDMVDLGAHPVAPPGFRFEGDFQGRDNTPQDEVGHGTHVAGTIACLSNNGTGVAGVTWNCRILPVRVLARIVNIGNPNDVRGVGSSADIAAGIRWAVDHGARVINMSLGGPSDTQVERDAVAYAVAHGVVVVAAMGNDGTANPSFPAAYPSVVAVGAIDQADHRAAFSQTGPHIDVSGPGVGILSTVWNNGFATMSGTSMATPHVAGVAALILSCNGNLTGAQVADILRQTARPLRDHAADPVPNNNYGFGCVDALAALNRACPRPASQPIISCPAPSVVVRCPSQPISCPSVIVRCPTRTIVCASATIACPPSVVIRCTIPSVPITTCFQISNPIVTCPQPSVTLRCPSGPVCGVGPLRPDNPGQDMSASLGYDPYGTGSEGWDDYDPYSMNYGDEGGCE